MPGAGHAFVVIGGKAKNGKEKEIYRLWLQSESGADGKKMSHGKGNRQGRNQGS